MTTSIIPIWVTDPTGNNNPYLKILPLTIFVATYSATLDQNNNFLGPSLFYWSGDGINWTPANNDAVDRAEYGIDTAADYTNGMLAIISGYRYAIVNNNHLFQQIGQVSFDGRNWTTVVDPTGGTTSNINFVYDFANNGYNFTWLTNPGNVAQSHFVANPNPLSNGNPTLNGNSLGASFHPWMDSAQPAAPDFPSKVLKNPLPSGLTAVRYNMGDVLNDTFEYTATPITDAIVNSDTQWSAATWIQTLAGTPGALDTLWYAKFSS